METLLGNLLALHTAAGGHALLLSATLGSSARIRLLHGARGAPPTHAEAECLPYPAITTDLEPMPQIQKGGGQSKAVALCLDPRLGEPEAIAALALAAARAGARVLVVRNLHRDAVTTAQELFALAPDDPALFRCQGVATLHHGRFAREDRMLLDAAVGTAMGLGCPEGGRIVIGTQTLEQNLDIDADFLITDLCPADVLLQRLGRLHRHIRSDRPAGFVLPRATILSPADLAAHLGRGRIDRHGLGGQHGPYADLVAVEATRRLIVAHPEWTIPAMNRMLVERSTHPEAIDKLAEELARADKRWTAEASKTDGRRYSDLQAAMDAGIPWQKSFSEFEFPDNEARLATRLGARDLGIVFDPPRRGPFGPDIKSLSIPSFWVGRIDLEKDTAPANIVDDQLKLTFQIQDDRFTYDRLGLSREAADEQRSR